MSMTDVELNGTVYIHNPLEEDFTFTWDKQPVTVPAKTTMPLSLFLAKHGGKHLIDYIILHPEFWPKLGLDRDDTEEKFDAEGKQIKVKSNLAKGREEIAKLINVTAPAMEALSSYKAPATVQEAKKGPGRPKLEKPAVKAEAEFPELPQD